VLFFFNFKRKKKNLLAEKMRSYDSLAIIMPRVLSSLSRGEIPFVLVNRDSFMQFFWTGYNRVPRRFARSI
jgi:hypothetical protein